MNRTTRHFATVIACVLLITVAAYAHADLTLAVGDSQVYEFDGITATAVGSTAVIDIVPLSTHRLLVNARGLGRTTLFVYDQHGKHEFHIAVIAAALPDLAPVATQIQADIGLPNVTAHALKDTILLEGSVTTPIAFQRAGTIAGVYAAKIKNLLLVVPETISNEAPSLAQTYAALLTENFAATGITVHVMDENTIALVGKYTPPIEAAFADASGLPRVKATKQSRKSSPAADQDGDGSTPLADESDMGSAAETRPTGVRDPLDRMLSSLPPELRVVNLLNITARPIRQVLVRAKIIDIDRAAEKDLGVNWGTAQTGGTRGGYEYSFQPQPVLFSQYQSSSFGGLFSGGALNRVSPIAAQINLLISENKARVLSQPSLMVLDGSEGSILVGGEIPIPVAQSSSGTNGNSEAVSIEYKPFGVRLRVSPTLTSDTTIQLTVTPEVSELDYGNAVEISGFSIPALTVRRATSTLQMEDGETLIIGGLYSSSLTKQTQRIPLLSQLPIIGQLFRNTSTHKEESELLILIQPEIVKPGTPGAHPSPEDNFNLDPGGKPKP